MTVIMEKRIDSDAREEAINEAKLEQLLSEKLMQGYVLLESSCPVCSTPLVKNHQMVPKNLSSGSSDSYEDGQLPKHVLLPRESFDQPFRPVEGVPICVTCNSHVITQETEVSILEQCDSLKDKGSIYVALNDIKQGHINVDDGSDDPLKENKTPPEIINLEDVEEEKFMDGRETIEPEYSHLKVDIQAVECSSIDGQSCFEILPSPRLSSAEIFIDAVMEEEPEKGEEEEKEEYEEQQQPSHPEPIFVEDPAYVNSIAVHDVSPESPQQSDDIVVEKEESNVDDQNQRQVDETNSDDSIDEEEDDYSARREIATKVLGAKMLPVYAHGEYQGGHARDGRRYHWNRLRE